MLERNSPLIRLLIEGKCRAALPINGIFSHSQNVLDPAGCLLQSWTDKNFDLPRQVLDRVDLVGEVDGGRLRFLGHLELKNSNYYLFTWIDKITQMVYNTIVENIKFSISCTFSLFSLAPPGKQRPQRDEIKQLGQRYEWKAHKEAEQSANVRYEIGKSNQFTLGEASEVSFGEVDVQKGDVFSKIKLIKLRRTCRLNY